MNKEIPIIFSVNDTYLPFLDISLRSLIENANKDYNYKIFVLNTGLNQENVKIVKQLENDNFEINFLDISDHVAKIHDKLRNVFHFSLATYYRLFVGSLFPEYSKVLYLDCDTVVLGNVEELYNTDLNGNVIAGAIEWFICSTPEFRRYAKEAVGVLPEKYVNAGILVIDLDKFRSEKIEENFIELIQTYNFDVIDPDQAYINFLCKDKIKYLPNGWNKTAGSKILEGKLNLVHYALAEKPWQYDNVPNGEYFWQYAKKSPFYDYVLNLKANFSEEDKQKRIDDAIKIRQRGIEIAESNDNFYKTLILGAQNGTIAI